MNNDHSQVPLTPQEAVKLLLMEDDQLGYRALNLGPDSPPGAPDMEAVNPRLQAMAEDFFWKAYRLRDTPSPPS